MICPACHGRHGWWVNLQGKRIDRPSDEPGDHPARWHECEECIGGIASCCDAAGSEQPPGMLNYKLVGFCKTDRIAFAHKIPASCISQAKELAGIADNPAVIADWPLSSAQAAAVAQLIGKSIDPARYEYTLEPYVACAST